MANRIINTFKISEGERVCIINLPVSSRGELEELPNGVLVVSRPVGKFDLVVLFTNSKNELISSHPRLLNALKPNGRFWIAYPKKQSLIYNELDAGIISEQIKVIDGVEIEVLDDWIGIQLNNFIQ